MVNARERTRQLIARARAEGFDAVAVAPAGKLKRDSAALAAWLVHGHHAGMDWMERGRSARADPKGDRVPLPACARRDGSGTYGAGSIGPTLAGRALGMESTRPARRR